MFSVLIQPFHCLIFVIFVSTSIDLLNGTFASAVFAIVTIVFMFQAEKIIKTIFGFRQPATMGDAVKSVATVMTGAKLMTSLGAKAGAKVANSNSPKQYWNNTKAEATGNTGNNGNQSETNNQNNSSNQSNQSNSNNQGNQNNSNNQNSSNNGAISGKTTRWTQYKQRHPNVATGLTIAGRGAKWTATKAPLKALKWGTSAGVAALGVGNNNMIASIQMAAGVNGAMTATGQGIKQRKYAQSLNNDLYLAGEKYDKRIQNVAGQITAEKGAEIEERIMQRLMKQGIGETEAKEQAQEQAQKQILQMATTHVNKETYRAINEPNVSRIKDDEIRELAIILQGCVGKYHKLGTDEDKAKGNVYKQMTGEKV